MKNLFISFISIVFCVSLYAQTNHILTLPDLPEQFDGMTNADVYPGLVPVAIYYYRTNDSKVLFTAVGSMFSTDTNKCCVVVSEHIYAIAADPECLYAFRIARPDSHHIDGFLGSVLMTSKDMFGCDIAVVNATNTPTPVRAFSHFISTETNRIISVLTDVVKVDGIQIKTLRSHITGKIFPVVGYGFDSTEEMRSAEGNANLIIKTPHDGTKRPLIAIKKASIEGESGTAFIDEKGRIFLISSGIDKRKVNPSSDDMTFVTGPLGLELQ